jgi:hypothetical protein
VSPICQCYNYGGWQPDDWCTEAKCTFGPTGCSMRSWTYSYNAVLESLTVAFIAGTFLYGLSVGVSGRKMCRRNVLTIVFFCTLGAVVAHGLWHGAVFAATVVPSGTQLPMVLVQKPVAIPMFTIFSVRTIVLFCMEGSVGIRVVVQSSKREDICHRVIQYVIVEIYAHRIGKSLPRTMPHSQYYASLSTCLLVFTYSTTHTSSRCSQYFHSH